MIIGVYNREVEISQGGLSGAYSIPQMLWQESECPPRLCSEFRHILPLWYSKREELLNPNAMAQSGLDLPGGSGKEHGRHRHG